MSGTVWEQCVARLTARLHAVRATRDVPVSVWDGSHGNFERSHGMERAVGLVRVEAWGDIGSGNASIVANELEGQIIRKAMTPDLTLGDLCRDISINGTDRIWPDANAVVVGVVVEFNISYQYDIGNPYLNSKSI